VTAAQDATRLKKRSLSIAGHRTSISLEEAFWEALRRLAARRGLSVAGIVAEIDAARGPANLSSAIRVHLLADADQRGGAANEAQERSAHS
jgi:predicted DNA-binding ribbon-helix-helix protein